MRQAGLLAAEGDAQRIADYLLTRGVETEVMPDGEAFGLWVHDEDQLDEARAELHRFQQNPADDRYAAAQQRAHQLRQEEEDQRKEAERNFHDMRRKWASTSGRVGAGQVTKALVGICVVVALLTGFGARGRALVDLLMLTPYPVGLGPLFSGQIWRLVTPIFLHFGVFHLAMNMLWFWQLGGLMESAHGGRFLLKFVVISAVLSNVIQVVWSGPVNFGGMSGVDAALLAYFWARGRYAGGGVGIAQGVFVFMLVWFGLGIVGIIPGMANGAHVGGLIVGLQWGCGFAWLRELAGKLGLGGGR